MPLIAVGTPQAWHWEEASSPTVGLATQAALNTAVSNPPSGKCKVTNLFVDPVTGKLVVEYDNTPTP